jgi:hypothetical protein
MSIFSDVLSLYGGVEDIWGKSRAHILAHVALVVVVFVICGVTVPEVTIPTAKQITENEWFKLAKDTGLIYASFVFPVIVIAAYAEALRIAGIVLVPIVFGLTSPRQNPLTRLGVSGLVPLALTLKKKDFTISDLTNKAVEFSQKYQSKKTEGWDVYQKWIADLSKNSQVYFGDFLVFVLTWILLFKVTPQSAWTQANQPRFWPVTIVLTSLACFAGFRVSRVVATIPSLLLMYVSVMLPSDPDVAPLLEVTEEDRDHVRQRLKELLQKEQETADSRPSPRRFLSYRLGFGFTLAAEEAGTGRQGGFPFRSFYERGARFSWDKEQNERYDSQWLSGYLAYLYYRLHDRLSIFVKFLWVQIRFFVTGVPPT